MSGSPIKILFISNDPSIFMEHSSARERMRAYAKEIGTLHILSRGAGSVAIREDLGNDCVLILHPCDLRGIKGKKPFVFFELLKQARIILQEEKIQLVSAQDPFEYGWVAMKAVRGTEAKLHIQVHTDPFSLWFTRVKISNSTEVRMPLINKVRQWVADKVLPEAAGIRVVSKRVQDSLIARYGDRIPFPSLIPIAVSAELPPKAELPPHSFTFSLITVGRLEPEKRIQDILAALAQIHSRYPSVGLFVVGEGSERKNLERYAKKLGIYKSVQFLGQIDTAWGIVQSAQVYIQASGYEGYSRTLLEAALARVPIITTDVGIVGEVFKGYEDLLSAPPGDPAALATHIIGLLEDNEARIQFVINAEKAARNHLENAHTSPADIALDLRNTLERHI